MSGDCPEESRRKNKMIDTVIQRLQHLYDLCTEHGRDMFTAHRCYTKGIEQYRTEQLKRLNIESLYPLTCPLLYS